MKVEIYSDVVCPWCYIGKRRFEKALAAFPGAADVEVVYRPFQLNPAASEAGEPAAQAYERKFGRPAQSIFGPFTEAAAGEGVTFRMDDAVATNTFTAHRLLWFAERHGRQGAVKEALMAHYFTNGGHLGDHAALAEIGAAAGLDRAEVAAFLASQDGVAEVRAGLAEAAQLGITSVPTFVFDGAVAVQGAQSPELLLEVMTKVAAEA
ncbi:putative DsbA family dithiol-disulfide isomerase [Kitasatospora sp. MAA4]|uniref:DsbA family oxidoreductase n=1 Tax=Kitasatospora sp. MAA4 TaxID=3035093 RepID=UPI0024754921|nr:DsbA family oxidoreductase [Kitasatospora sp. MAA4]MDH6137614.1 putative DsbA family dithiol-disulfide isomerase [Kitasatospora sp. MAA4]